MLRDLERFDPTIPIERATTPPASWYTDPGYLELERQHVLHRTWQAAGPLERLARPGNYLTGEVAGEPYVAVRGADGTLRAFFNVCRHHASCVASGEGTVTQLVCPYHGWTYDLNGRLRKAPRLGGVEQFDREQFGLWPMEAAAWGPFAFVRVARGDGTLDELLAPLAGRLADSKLRFVARRSYEIACNWKVFVDNYLDGGYHVGHLHHGLAAQLDLASYRTEIAGRVSIQSCGAGAGETTNGDGGGDFVERVAGGALYAFVYPNFMINRYGPILDTNWVIPLDHERTLTLFDYYFEREGAGAEADFIERSIAASDQVQQEDIAICESVQRGLRSAAFDTGRYAPGVEQAAHHFHRLLAADLRRR